MKGWFGNSTKAHQVNSIQTNRATPDVSGYLEKRGWHRSSLIWGKNFSFWSFKALIWMSLSNLRRIWRNQEGETWVEVDFFGRLFRGSSRESEEPIVGNTCGCLDHQGLSTLPANQPVKVDSVIRRSFWGWRWQSCETPQAQNVPPFPGGGQNS